MPELKKEPRYTLSTILSVAGGILIIFSATIFSFWHIALFPHMESMMGTTQFANSTNLAILVRVVLGGVVTAGALLMYKKPNQIRIWGVIVLIFSGTSLVGLGDFVVGAIFGIVGGILAIVKKQ